MEFTGVVNIDGTFGDSQARVIVHKCEEHKDVFLETQQDPTEQGWAIPARFSSNRVWIECITINDVNWHIEMAVVKSMHWPD